MTEGGEGAHLLETVWLVQCAVARSLKALWISGSFGSEILLRLLSAGGSNDRGPQACGDPGRRRGRLQPTPPEWMKKRTLARPSGRSRSVISIDPAIAAHRGRIVKRTGDGSMIEFRSVIDAVRCAIEVADRHGRA